MSGGDAVLEAPDVDQALLEIHHVPPESDHLTDPQTVPVGHQNKRLVTVTVAPCLLGGLQQLIDLVR